MRLRIDQFAASLKNRLAPVYLLSGDEPLQLSEAADQLRKAAKEAGYHERELLQVDAKFDWAEFRQAADSLSLFSERKLIDLRMPTGKPGKEGARVLKEYCADLPGETILMITTGKLTPASQKSVWFKALEKSGTVIQVWPLEGDALIKWLHQRMLSRGLQADRSGLKLLAERVEGNLLAAAQEVDKLYVLHGEGRIDSERILDLVSRNARFNVFALTDAVLAGNGKRIGVVMEGLRQEAIVPSIILWALAREARLLLQLAWLKERRQPLDSVYQKERVWNQRKTLLATALQRLKYRELQSVIKLGAKTDRMIKGQEAGEVWDSLMQMAMRLAGLTTISSTDF